MTLAPIAPGILPSSEPAPSTVVAQPEAAAGAMHAERIVGLDGLRAIAVTAVVVYHLGIGWLPGGFLGVDLFFVISGFLITTLLLAEVADRGRIHLGAFYLRRARRLLPALFVMLAATLVLVATVARDVAAQTLRDVPAALGYVSNWWAIAADQSYFELIGRGAMLGHLWSLAVEEQFYLLWPLVLGGLALLARRMGWRVRRTVGAVALVGALASTAWMVRVSVAQGFPIDADPTRAYFGTDTHAMSVLVGAALAAVWRVAGFRRVLAPGARALVVAAGVLGLAASGALLMWATEYSPWLYRGGFLIAALTFAVVVAAASHPGAPLGRALDNVPMRWVGERSYGIYLWHWPLFLVTRPGLDLPWTGAWVQVARGALVLAVAAVSYRFVEVPVRQGALGRWAQGRVAEARAGGLVSLVPATRRAALAVVGAAAAVLVTVGLLVTAPTSAEVAATSALGAPTDVVDGATSRTAGTVTTTQTAPAVPGVGWYGDSVSLWSVDALRAEFPGVRLDAGINRSPAFIFGRVLADREAGELPTAVVLQFGNGGPVPEADLDRTLAALADRTRVVLVNSTGRFAYVRPGNETMARVAASHPNVVVVDWAGASAGHPEWFTDGLHLTDVGELEFADAVSAALA